MKSISILLGSILVLTLPTVSIGCDWDHSDRTVWLSRDPEIDYWPPTCWGAFSPEGLLDIHVILAAVPGDLSEIVIGFWGLPENQGPGYGEISADWDFPVIGDLESELRFQLPAPLSQEQLHLGVLHFQSHDENWIAPGDGIDVWGPCGFFPMAVKTSGSEHIVCGSTFIFDFEWGCWQICPDAAVENTWSTVKSLY